MSQCIITNYGLEIITRAISQGSTINVTGVKLGSTNSFTLDPSMTTIPDIVFTSTSQTNLQSIMIDTDTLEFRCYFGTTVGPFNIGSVGIYDSNDSLIMVGKFDELYEKKITTEDEAGNTLQFILPVNVDNISEGAVVTQLQFDIDNSTIKLNQANQLSSQVVPHHIFDIYYNASTKTPPGAFPMWTGETVDCDGVRTAFYNEAIARRDASTIRVLTEAQWQAEVAANGWTNAFVIDTSFKTIRLPKLLGVAQVTNPATAVLTGKVDTSTGSTNLIPLPMYIQVETTAVPATIAQCNEFSNLLRTYITRFNEFDNLYVKLAGTNTVTANNTWSGTNTFTSTIQGTAYKSLWADLAEYYEADKPYEPGTLLQFGGDKEVTLAKNTVNAVVSSEPGLVLGHKIDEDAGNRVLIALAGKVPVRVRGSVKKFQKLVLAGNGVAEAKSDSLYGISFTDDDVIGIALENCEASNLNEEHLIMCVTKFKF